HQDLAHAGAAAVVDQVARAGIDVRLDHVLEQLLGEDDEAILARALVRPIEDLVEPLARQLVGRPEHRNRERGLDRVARAGRERCMARCVERERVHDVDLDQGTVDVIKRRGILVLRLGLHRRELVHSGPGIAGLSMVGMEGMRVPVWLTLGVALLVCLFGAYRIRLAFRSDAEDERARQRKGLYAVGRRTHFLVGLIYLLLGGALVATSFGWNPFSGVF